MEFVSRIGRGLGSDTFGNVVMLVGRLLLGLPFPIFGVMKYVNQGNMQAYIESEGLPGAVIYIVIPLQIVGGAAVWLGFGTRWAAFLLGGFCIVASALYHNHLSDPGELAAFTKDYATAGGYLFLWKFGPGKYSLDAWRRSVE